jgi:anti-sigma B factor antagonist
MPLTIETVAGVAICRLPLEILDAGNAAEFKREMTPVIETNPNVVLDLTRLRFVDSSGLGALISCLRLVNARGGDLKLFGMSSDVRAVFELVRMDRVFEIFPTSDDALRAFTHDAAAAPAVRRPLTVRASP